MIIPQKVQIMTPSNQKTGRDLLFWSGGKDSFLALRQLQKDTGRDPILFTTYDDESGRVPHQNIPVETIRRQALALGLIAYTVPLSYPATNSEYLEALKNRFESFPFEVRHLVFGDLHLKDIRKWREKQFGEMGFDLLFPIWQTQYDDLFGRLENETIKVRISAVMDKYSDIIEKGAKFDLEFAESLPNDVDKMGENGEFHTEISLK